MDSPFIASQIVNSFYNALLAEQKSGIPITVERKVQLYTQIFILWQETSEILVKLEKHAEYYYREDLGNISEIFKEPDK